MFIVVHHLGNRLRLSDTQEEITEIVLAHIRSDCPGYVWNLFENETYVGTSWIEPTTGKFEWKRL